MADNGAMVFDLLQLQNSQITFFERTDIKSMRDLFSPN